MGKSVALKDTVAPLCGRDDIDPRRVVFCSVDGMRPRDLDRLFVLGRDLTRSVGELPRIWLLDEITGINGWAANLKFHRDNSPLGDDTVVCAGSSWAPGETVERSLFAGRAGEEGGRRLRLMFPMTFRDVVSVTRPEINLPESVHPWDLQDSGLRRGAGDWEFVVDDLDLAWQDYLTSGGFPRAVGERHQLGEVSNGFLEDLAAWLHQDVDPDAPRDSVPRLLSEIAARSTSPLPRASVSEALGYPSRSTFDRRLNRLVNAFAALWCHQVDDRGRRVPGSVSKLYLSDPLLAWIGPRLRAGLPEPDFTHQTEAALAVALARSIDRREPGRWMADDAVGYIRTGGGKAIDLAPVPVLTPGGTRMTNPIESKWVSGGWRSEARSLEGKYGSGVMATKNVIDLDNSAWAIPAPILALLLE